MPHLSISLTTVILLLLLSGCDTEKNQASESEKGVVSGEIELSNGWARPGKQEMMSAVYLTISNETSSADTLVEVSSETAQSAEVHESYKGENGMSAMRPAPNRVIESKNNLYLQPGGLHIMLKNLKNDLASGDSVKIRIEFKRTGTQTIRLPVKAQN